MNERRIGIIMNGVTGRMGLNQHLVRSILAIRKEGGVALADGSLLIPDPILVGRSATKLEQIAREHNVERWTTDLAGALSNPDDSIYFDAQVTALRAASVEAAIAAGKHVYCEKPLAEGSAAALRLDRLARAAGVKHGIVQDKLFLPGMRKLKRLVDGGFFGRILSVRGEFGYWVFEGNLQPAQRPSWNYRKQDGGGIIMDMFCHWRYVLDHTFGKVRAVQCHGGTAISQRWDERGIGYECTADDTAYGTFELEGGIVAQINSSWAFRVYRDELFSLQVDGTLGSAVAGLRECRTQHRVNTPRPFGIPTSRIHFAFANNGRTYRITRRSTMHSRSSGNYSCVTLRKMRHFPMTSWKARGACNSQSWASNPGTSVAGSKCPSWRADLSTSVKLVHGDGTFYNYSPSHAPLVPAERGPFQKRVAFAAAHVVLDPLRTTEPLTQPAIDWEATLAFRDYLWSLGFGVAEAMDTAQRGMGLDWPLALELIKRSTAAARARGAVVASGAGTDHLPPGKTFTTQDVINGYLEQCEAIEAAGGRIILMASRALAAAARHADEYASVYARVLSQVREPVILHWLGPMFDAALAGYWGEAEFSAAMQSCLAIIRAHKEKIDGIKISLLDRDLEIAMRRQLPPGVRMYTGDDFNYDRLILGDEQGHSDALLGIFDAIAPAASLAFSALDAGDIPLYHQLLAPTVPLSRRIFATPTQHYKTGVVFLAYLNGFQDHFHMVAGMQSARSIAHLCELFALADQAGVLRDPELASRRMRKILLLAGIE